MGLIQMRQLFSTSAPDAEHPERRMAREASPLGHPVKIIKISLESKLSILDFYDFHRVLNSYKISLESKLSIRDFYDFHGVLNSYNKS